MSANDIVIRGGLVVDGTGVPARRADVGVKDGRIAEVGQRVGSGARTIDADGAIVTPGFIDIHTHYDGQISWDADLAPSCFHGVTTAVLGSCGVGFAPCRERDQKRLIDLMEGVEDIPGAALAEGIRFGWETIPEYMSAIDASPHTMDFAVHVVHDALRVYVMGERAVAGEPATEDDVARMRLLLREALLEGAIGFSTGRTDNHRAADGSPTPASEASERELAGIASAFHGLGHGVLQAVSDFDMSESRERFDGEFDLLERMVEAAGGHALSISLMQRQGDSEQWKRIVARAETAAARGLPMKLQVGARGIGVILGLEATFHPFRAFPSYADIEARPLAERVSRMRDPAFKARLLAETPRKIAGDGSPIPPLADKLLGAIDFVAAQLFRLEETPDYEPKRERSIYAEALGRGVSSLDAIYDALLEDDGRQLLYFPIYNYMEGNLDAVHAMLSHPLALAGLGDGGAHVGTICDASFPTYMLMHWARDRENRLDLPRVVRMLTHDNARHMGFADRGTIEVGKNADLNVIDYERLALGRPRLVADLPAGGKRFLQRAHGYVATIASGEVILERDELTGARPGRLVRLGN
jgi:N-acyl-D-aspartate/D-glutamate deacylase